MYKESQFFQTSKVVFSIFLLFLCALSGAAQEGTGTLRGAIFDPGGAIIPGALVSVVNQETGLNRRSLTTTSSGDYVFAALTPGLYRITVEASGFKTSIKDNVKLSVGETQEFNFSLQSGSKSFTVFP